jgi:hypothetical protein
MIRFRAILLAFTLALAVLSASNQTFAQEARWEPPEPDPVSKDWLRLGSGEWLRGEIHLLNDDKLEFESEDLDDLVLDWDDVAALLSPRILTYTFSDGEAFAGTATLRDSVFVIRSGEETREFARSNLLSIIEGEPTEWNFWSAKVSVGIIGRSGNTDQEDLNSIVLLRRQATRSRFDIEYKGNFARRSATTEPPRSWTFWSRKGSSSRLFGAGYTSTSSQTSICALPSAPVPGISSSARAVWTGTCSWAEATSPRSSAP